MEFDIGKICDARDTICDACYSLFPHEEPQCSNCYVNSVINEILN